MSKFKDFIKKFKYLIIVVGILIVGCIFLIVKKSFGVSTNTYTRDELQKMLVSAAVSYYYNNNYSDYEQYLLDADVKYPDLSSSNNECVLNYKNYKNATKCVSENNHYPLVSTTFFRNLNITPEEVSRSNMYNTDCTGFTYLVYNNVLGYDLSEFYSFSGTADVVRISTDGVPDKRRAISSKSDYYEAVDKFGRAWNSTGNLTRIANCLVYKKGVRKSCIFSSLSDEELKKYNTDGEYSKKGVSYVDSSNKSELVYNYNFKNLTYGNSTNYTNYLTEWNTIKKYFDKKNSSFLMQPGDMLKIAYTSNGHVMVYVGEAFNANDAGLIHSTGTDGKPEDFSVRYESNIYNYLNDKLTNLKKDGDKKRITSISIIRPINKYCSTVDGKETCTNNNISSNDKARVAFSGTRVEQYVVKDHRGISTYNSVDVGDTVTYSIRLEDKRKYGYCSNSSKTKETCVCPKNNPNCGLEWIKTGYVYDNSENASFKIKFTLPQGTTISKCPKDFKPIVNSDNSIISCEGTTSSKYSTFGVVINSSSSGKIGAGKFEVTYKGSTLTLETIELNVNRTVNSNDVDKLNKTVGEFKGKNYTYSTSDQISKNSNINTTTKFSSLDFIKYIYYNNFNIDLSYLTGQKITDSLFFSWSKSNTEKYKDVNYTYNISAFFKKDGTDNISKMLVDGMYGGKKLIGNENAKRIKYIHNKYFEVGDIIVVSDKFIDNFSHDRAGTALNFSLTTIDPTKDFKYYLVSGFDSSGYPNLINFDNNGINSCNKDEKVFDGDGNYLMNPRNEDNKPYSYICSFRVIKHLLYSSNLFAVLRPTKLYNDVSYNVTSHIDSNTVSNKLKYNDVYDKKISTPTKKGYNFDGWYFDESFENKAVKVNVHTNHDIYAKFSLAEYNLTIDADGGTYSGDKSIKIAYGSTYTLPAITKTGYTFVGWEVTGSGSSVNGNVFKMGTENATVKAIWKANDKLVFDNSLSVDANNKIIYNINAGTIINSILNKIATNGTITLYDNTSNVIDKTNKAGTGYIISFKFDSKTVNYVLVVTGDVTGDGNVTLLDVSNAFKENRNKTNNFDIYKRKAIDFDNNNTFDYNDILKQVVYYGNLRRR